MTTRTKTMKIIERTWNAIAWLLAVTIVVMPLAAYAQTPTETITHFHNDIAGSPLAASDAAGNVIWQESYQPYGDRMLNSPASIGNKLWFHGKQVDDDSGLSYFGARSYDPVLGRFMAVDPERFDERVVHSFGRYTYGNDNPYTFRDPDGREVVFSAEAEKFLANMMAKSPTARQMMGELARSKTIYEFVIDSKAKSPASTEVMHEKVWVQITINPEAVDRSRLRDSNKKEFTPTVERAIAHEMGHAVVIDALGSVIAQHVEQQRKASEYENRVARELNPKAPLRDMSGDAHWGYLRRRADQ